jgi:hypothetical protein
MNLIAAWPRMRTPDVAAEYAGGEKLFADLIEKGLTPKTKGKGFTRYDRLMVDAALDVWPGFDN